MSSFRHPSTLVEPPSRAGTRIIVAALTIPFAGCGGYPSRVEGVVTLDGRPLPAARVTFHPDAPGPVAYGLSLADGSYRLKTGAKGNGLTPGGYRVTVFAMEVAEGPAERAGPLLTPPIYSDPAKTPLRCEISRGLNAVPLALDSSAGP